MTQPDNLATIQYHLNRYRYLHLIDILQECYPACSPTTDSTEYITVKIPTDDHVLIEISPSLILSQQFSETKEETPTNIHNVSNGITKS